MLDPHMANQYVHFLLILVTISFPAAVSFIFHCHIASAFYQKMKMISKGILFGFD